MIDLELTPKIKEWLDTEPSDRDIMAGAEILLRITRNRILYTNIVRNPQLTPVPLNTTLTKYICRGYRTSHTGRYAR